MTQMGQNRAQPQQNDWISQPQYTSLVCCNNKTLLCLKKDLSLDAGSSVLYSTARGLQCLGLKLAISPVVWPASRWDWIIMVRFCMMSRCSRGEAPECLGAPCLICDNLCKTELRGLSLAHCKDLTDEVTFWLAKVLFLMQSKFLAAVCCAVCPGISCQCDCCRPHVYGTAGTVTAAVNPNDDRNDARCCCRMTESLFERMTELTTGSTWLQTELLLFERPPCLLLLTPCALQLLLPGADCSWWPKLLVTHVFLCWTTEETGWFCPSSSLPCVCMAVRPRTPCATWLPFNTQCAVPPLERHDSGTRLSAFSCWWFGNPRQDCTWYKGTGTFV